MSRIVPSGTTPIGLDDQLAAAIELHRLSPANDAFGRARVSNPVTRFASAHQYDASPDFWETTLTSNGTATHLPNESAVRLRTTTVSGDKVVRQTYRYFRYLPGKSQLILVTGTLGAAAANVRKRLGYFDASNGLFFEQTSAGMFVVRRTSVSGTPDDVRVAQADWNIDPMNGSGPSGLVLDPAKSNIFVIDFEWLGVGRQRFGVNIDGMTYYVHEIDWANRGGASVYMTTANLPVRYEIENTGTAVSATNDLIQICSTVVSEGGTDGELQTRLRSASNGVTTIGVTTRRPILSIRPKLTFNSIANRALISPANIEFINTGG